MKAQDNPFTSRRVEALPFEWVYTSESEMLSRVEKLNYRAAIVGAKGTGKTTLLEYLQKTFTEKGFDVRLVRLCEENRIINFDEWKKATNMLSQKSIILLDGLEQLPYIRWLHFKFATRNALGLIATTHNEGRLPTLVNHITTPELLKTLLSKLIDTTNIENSKLQSLFQKHNGNIRNIFFEMYDAKIHGE